MYTKEGLSEETSTTGLDSFNLSLAPRKTLEPRRELGTVEVFSLLGLNGAQRGARATADRALNERATAQRAVLLGLDTVSSERVGEGA